MPVHDWTRVDAGIFHAFHHDWITELARALNRGLLPDTFYALPEQHAAGFGPDVLTLQGSGGDKEEEDTVTAARNGGLLVAAPTLQATAETDMEFYRRKQKSVVIHHVSGDRIVAMIEIVAPGNKSTRHALHKFIKKAAELLDQGIHLLIVDVLSPGPRDPQGIHAAVWDEIAGQEFKLAAGHTLALATYETDLSIRTYVQTLALGGALPDMPLFLAPNACVQVPLEITYQAAFAGMPRRWRKVLDA